MAGAHQALESQRIEYAVHTSGLVLCRNQNGLIFFLVTEPPAASKGQACHVPSAPAPKTKSKNWSPLPPEQEVPIHHDLPRPTAAALVSKPREVAGQFTTVPSQHELSIQRGVAPSSPSAEPDLSHMTPAQAAVCRLKMQSSHGQAPCPGTGPLNGAPAPGAKAAGGWFRKLFSGQ